MFMGPPSPSLPEGEVAAYALAAPSPDNEGAQRPMLRRTVAAAPALAGASATPSYLAISGWLAWGVQGERDLHCCFYHPPHDLSSSSGGGLAGRTATAAGLLDLLAILRMLCSASSPSPVLYCRLCLTFAEDKNRHGKKWPHLLLSTVAAGPAGGARSCTYSYLCYLTASHCIWALARVSLYVVSECVPT